MHLLKWKLLGVYEVFNKLRAFLSFVSFVSYCWKHVTWTDMFILIDHSVLRLEHVSLD